MTEKQACETCAHWSRANEQWGSCQKTRIYGGTLKDGRSYANKTHARTTSYAKLVELRQSRAFGEPARPTPSGLMFTIGLTTDGKHFCSMWRQHPRYRRRKKPVVLNPQSVWERLVEEDENDDT